MEGDELMMNPLCVVVGRGTRGSRRRINSKMWDRKKNQKPYVKSLSMQLPFNKDVLGERNDMSPILLNNCNRPAAAAGNDVYPV
jgi:hypothetical protein